MDNNKKRIVATASIIIGILLILGVVLGMLALPSYLPKLSGDYVVKKGTAGVACFADGTFDVAMNDKTIIADAYCEFGYNGKKIKSTDYSVVNIVLPSVGSSTEYKKVNIVCEDDKYPTLNINIVVYEKSYLTIQAQVVDKNNNPIDSISPIVANRVDFSGTDRFLEVPFDNDRWDTFDVKPLLYGGSSSEVGCFFSDKKDNGIVVGAITHQNWKNGVSHSSVSGQVKSVRATSGVKTQYDESKHGAVKMVAKEENEQAASYGVSSELFYISASKDWQNSMTNYAKVSAELTPKRESFIDGVPVGFNSWGAIQGDINFDKAVAVSDNIKANYQDSMEYAGNKVFINLDSYWKEGFSYKNGVQDGSGEFSEEKIKEFVEHCKANGQEAGIYWCPFACWNSKESLATTLVEGSTDVYLQEVVLKKANGKIYSNKVDGAFPLDPSHPAVLKRIELQISKFVEWGFKYVKLDFMSHGAMEGLHYDKNITTGIQAYNLGMQKITEVAGDDMFINLSIAPIFPYQYANGRRIACDSFYKIKDTKYTLNALTYGFWTSEFYDYPDPDHILLWGKDGGAEFNEAESRLLSGVISGTSILFGDDLSDLTNAQKRERLTLINNPELMKIAGLHKAFTPVLQGKYSLSANIFKLEFEGKTYYAVFNFNKKKDKFEIAIDGNYSAKEILRGGTFDASNRLVVELEGKQAALIELTKNEKAVALWWYAQVSLSILLNYTNKMENRG